MFEYRPEISEEGYQLELLHDEDYERWLDEVEEQGELFEENLYED